MLKPSSGNATGERADAEPARALVAVKRGQRVTLDRFYAPRDG
jgi:hypothetical protein